MSIQMTSHFKEKMARILAKQWDEFFKSLAEDICNNKVIKENFRVLARLSDFDEIKIYGSAIMELRMMLDGPSPDKEGCYPLYLLEKNRKTSTSIELRMVCLDKAIIDQVRAIKRDEYDKYKLEIYAYSSGRFHLYTHCMIDLIRLKTSHCDLYSIQRSVRYV